jgi:hypothetical protein
VLALLHSTLNTPIPTCIAVCARPIISAPAAPAGPAANTLLTFSKTTTSNKPCPTHLHSCLRAPSSVPPLLLQVPLPLPLRLPPRAPPAGLRCHSGRQQQPAELLGRRMPAGAYQRQIAAMAGKQCGMRRSMVCTCWGALQCAARKEADACRRLSRPNSWCSERTGQQDQNAEKPRVSGVLRVRHV